MLFLSDFPRRTRCCKIKTPIMSHTLPPICRQKVEVLGFGKEESLTATQGQEQTALRVWLDSPGHSGANLYKPSFLP